LKTGLKLIFFIKSAMAGKIVKHREKNQAGTDLVYGHFVLHFPF